MYYRSIRGDSIILGAIQCEAKEFKRTIEKKEVVRVLADT